MNEQIQRLVEQATVATDQELYQLSQGIEGMPSRLDLFNQKFAELIVRECAERLLNDAKLTDIQTARCVASIREHFGVE